MKVELFPFQKIALQNLRVQVEEARGSYQRTHTPQIVSYTAPTGAGKTIIMSALIESILNGDEFYPDQLDSIFVWLSDSPELNQQSKDTSNPANTFRRFSPCWASDSLRSMTVMIQQAPTIRQMTSFFRSRT